MLINTTQVTCTCHQGPTPRYRSYSTIMDTCISTQDGQYDQSHGFSLPYDQTGSANTHSTHKTVSQPNTHMYQLCNHCCSHCCPGVQAHSALEPWALDMHLYPRDLRAAPTQTSRSVFIHAKQCGARAEDSTAQGVKSTARSALGQRPAAD
jgi:hypothetical protein